MSAQPAMGIGICGNCRDGERPLYAKERCSRCYQSRNRTGQEWTARPAPQPIDPEQWFPLVYWTIRQKVPYWIQDKYAREELFQEGVVGLLNAIRLYDPARGVTFKTYAVSKICWSILIFAGLTRQGWRREGYQLPRRLLGDDPNAWDVSA